MATPPRSLPPICAPQKLPRNTRLLTLRVSRNIASVFTWNEVCGDMVSAFSHNAEIAPQGKSNYRHYTVHAALVRRILLFCETNFASSNTERNICFKYSKSPTWLWKLNPQLNVSFLEQHIGCRITTTAEQSQYFEMIAERMVAVTSFQENNEAFRSRNARMFSRSTARGKLLGDFPSEGFLCISFFQERKYDKMLFKLSL